MKEIRFETRKGKFIAIKRESNAFDVCMWSYKYELIGSLKEITEEEASDIVSYGDEFTLKNYTSAKDKLFKVLKSKGIHLFENPAPLLHYSRLEAESKTFYNPYIFKINE